MFWRRNPILIPKWKIKQNNLACTYANQTDLLFYSCTVVRNRRYGDISFELLSRLSQLAAVCSPEPCFFLLQDFPPFLNLRQSNRLALLFSPPQINLKNRPAACLESYRPHQIRVNLLTCSDFFETICACTAAALCEGVSTPIFDTVGNLLQINACLLQYSR